MVVVLRVGELHPSSGNSASEKISEPLHPQTTSPEHIAHYGLKAEMQEGELKGLEAWQDCGHSHPGRTREHPELLP